MRQGMDFSLLKGSPHIFTTNFLAMITAKITEQVIDTNALTLTVQDLASGAVVTFDGRVRNHDKEKKVEKLQYEIHPSAPQVLEKLIHEIAAKYEVINTVAVHRFGYIPIGESAFFVAVSAAHRDPALRCCEEIVERVKAELPIWKFQEFSDGNSEWVNSA